MLNLPEMAAGDGRTKQQQIQFRGYNHTAGAGDGEIFDMRNLCSEHYPVLATRQERRIYGRTENPGGVFAWDGLAYVDGSTFFFEGQARGSLTVGEKVMASMGEHIIILPDKVMYNVKTGEFKNMEASWTGSGVSFEDGVYYGDLAVQNTIRANGVNWADYFRPGDAVTISGAANAENNKTIIIREIDGDKLRFFEYSFTNGEDSGEIRIARTVPDLKFICENENRLWGCDDTTIYGSALGDPTNWNTFDGLATDSYAVDPGSAGAFQGCISYRGYATFFKEDGIHKVYGSEPGNFQVISNATLGLAKGCHKSLAIAGETLFYLSDAGVMAYTGGVPQPIGTVFGTERILRATAGGCGLKYWTAMEFPDGWRLFCYDALRGLWHREDEKHIIQFASAEGNLYMMAEDGTIYVDGGGKSLPEEREGAFDWFAEFADFTENSPDKKSISKVQLRLELEEDARCQVWIRYDSLGDWRKFGREMGEGVKRSYYLPVIPRRADHFRIRITGHGGCRIFSMAREVRGGSERKTYGRN